MKLADALALLLPTFLAACAGDPTQEDLPDLVDIGQAPLSGLIRVEARPDDGVFRIHNDGAKPFPVYYQVNEPFGPVLLWHRMRDGRGEPIDLGHGPGDWSTPADLSADLRLATTWGPRSKLVVPARGFVDLKDNVDAMVTFHDGRVGGPVYQGPCEIQVMFSAFPRRRTYKRVAAITGWMPSRCPQPFQQPTVR